MFGAIEKPRRIPRQANPGFCPKATCKDSRENAVVTSQAAVTEALPPFIFHQREPGCWGAAGAWVTGSLLASIPRGSFLRGWGRSPQCGWEHTQGSGPPHAPPPLLPQLCCCASDCPTIDPPPIMNCNNNSITLCSPIG